MSIPQHILERKGPRSSKELDPEALDFLNTGKTETRNLIEWLAVDQQVLLRLTLNQIDNYKWYSTFVEAIAQLKKPTANSLTRVIGETLGIQTEDQDIYQLLRKQSDVVRCWACWAQSLHHDDTADLLKAMKVYAADSHFGVREVVIFATKERLVDDLDTAIDVLSDWTKSEDENVRRYAVEVLRPVGVWTKKIAEFQDNPSKGLPLIEPLKEDPSKYVRDSVSNWINDAAKSNPDWAKTLVSDWTSKSDNKGTAYIAKRGLRSLK